MMDIQVHLIDRLVLGDIEEHVLDTGRVFYKRELRIISRSLGNAVNDNISLFADNADSLKTKYEDENGELDGETAPEQSADEV